MSLPLGNTSRFSSRAAKVRAVHLADHAPPLLALIVILAFAIITLNAAAQDSAYPPAAKVLQPQAYVSLQPVPRGRAFEIAVVAKISPGFHINAHVPSEDYLIPTKVTADLSPGG